MGSASATYVRVQAQCSFEGGFEVDRSVWEVTTDCLLSWSSSQSPSGRPSYYGVVANIRLLDRVPVLSSQSNARMLGARVSATYLKTN